MNVLNIRIHRLGACLTLGAISAIAGTHPISFALSSSPNPSVVGQAVTLTAGPTTGCGVFCSLPGTMTFYDGNTALGTATEALASFVLVTTQLAPGVHSLTASYSGDNYYAASTSAPVTQTVLALQITTASTLPNGVVGSPYAVTFATNAGTGSYTWALSSGSVPPGLTWRSSGVLSGTPTGAGTTTFTVTVTDSVGAMASATFSLTVDSSLALQFYPLAPCRIADTRATEPFTGAFGPPSLLANTERSFPILSSGCSIPSTAQAYSLNFTVVPNEPLGYLSVWPAGDPYPGVSTLNSSDGSTIANAGIVPAGTGGSIITLSSNPTDLIIDINGYFAQPGASGLDFFPLTPCRVADTRSTQSFTGAFGPPSLAAYVGRDFPISISQCLSGSEQAYSLNVTVVPPAPLGFLSIWPEGQPYPGVSTLNSPDGATLANAAIVPAGTLGDIEVLAGSPTDVIIDINGKFEAPGTGSLRLYPLTPCRIADTRASQSFTGAFGPPSLGAYTYRNFPIQSSSCGIPATAQAYALNMTVVPQGPLSFLSAWPAGQPYSGVSTLNSPNGGVIANAALVPAGTGGEITVITGNPTDLIIDIVGYFAP